MAPTPPPFTDDGADRGQTTQDFAFGISVFLLTAVFVVGFVPNVTTPYDTGITENEQEAAQAVGRTLQSELTVENDSIRLDAGRTNAFFSSDPSQADLRERFGLDRAKSVNVTIRELGADDGIVGSYAVGPDPTGQSAATSRWLVRLGGTVYRLEVTVW